MGPLKICMLTTYFCPAISSRYCLKFMNMLSSLQNCPEKLFNANKGTVQISTQPVMSWSGSAKQ